MNFSKLVLNLLTLIVIAGFSAAKADANPAQLAFGSTLPILGEIQFWKRACSAEGVCGFPKALGPKIKISGEISKPKLHRELGRYRQHVEQAGYGLDFTVFWKTTPKFPQGYLIFQNRISAPSLDRAVPIAECNQYRGIDADKLFPVGICSGYLRLPADQGSWQLGASFYAAK